MIMRVWKFIIIYILRDDGVKHIFFILSFYFLINKLQRKFSNKPKASPHPINKFPDDRGAGVIVRGVGEIPGGLKDSKTILRETTGRPKFSFGDRGKNRYSALRSDIP